LSPTGISTEILTEVLFGRTGTPGSKAAGTEQYPLYGGHDAAGMTHKSRNREEKSCARVPKSGGI